MDFNQWKKIVENMGGLNTVKSSAKEECARYQTEQGIGEFQKMVASNPMFSGLDIDTDTIREFFKQIGSIK